ncbi:fructose-bisphosphate aldolase [Nocardia stercoris]|uniref:Fructose-bisphosphate aldolase n=1 Tax=Nocardia stercoris TaxID=2483361 RepID=A0A3M2KVP4_9NOCA|nr:glycoside hydrolase family 76 protein [Nocardia stercoris]RMI28746.1 fructose-bisphosphate aldolase [Nocardia stercoris]
MATAWSQRADMAEAAVVSRHLRRLCVPGVELAVIGWPATRAERGFLTWDYWWQAHLVDCAVDAANRSPSPERTKRISAVARGIRTRNLTGWTNRYYDDMAWLALALERAERTQGLTDLRHGLAALEADLAGGFQPQVGALPWRKGDDYFNAPANGPAGIALARFGHTELALEISDWLDKNLRDGDSGLILDGIHLPGGEIERPTFTYCQGVVLGLETELALRTGETRHVERAQRLLDAVDEHLTHDGVVAGGGGGDGGLFNGILLRYLGLVAVMLPGADVAQVATRRTAARIVLASARAAWDHRLEVEGEPLFGPDWTHAAQLPGSNDLLSARPERALSVQLSGWLAMEAAYLVSAAGY